MENTKKRTRQSNIELCRIICMVLIIAHHCIVHSGAAKINPCANKLIAIFLIPGGKICFDAFIAISTWFLVEQSFKCERFIKIWGQTLFYSVLFTFLSMQFGVKLTGTEVMSAFLPITGNVHGYVAAYLMLYALVPFFRLIIQNITKTQTEVLVFVLFVSNVLSQFVGNITEHYQKISSNVGLFAFFFFLSYYFKKYPVKIMESKLSLFFVFALCWCVISCAYYLVYYHPQNETFKILQKQVNSHFSIICIIGGYSLFLLFNNLKLKPLKIINVMAKPTLAILMIHDHNFFRPVVWNKIIKADTWYYSEYFIVYVVLTVLFIYLTCSLIEYLRVMLIERKVMKLKVIRDLEVKIDEVINNSVNGKEAISE